MATASLTIGDLARTTGTKVETIRYYERAGLLPRALEPQRQLSGLYGRPPEPSELHPPCTRPWLQLEQIRALLDLADQRDRACEAVDAIARAHLAEVERKIADLSALRRNCAS